MKITSSTLTCKTFSFNNYIHVLYRKGNFINLEADGQVQLPDVDGLPTFIINKEWRTYSMYRLRDGNRKRGVRIVDLSDPSPIVSVPSVALDADIPFSFSPGQNLNPPQVSAPPERPAHTPPRTAHNPQPTRHTVSGVGRF